MRSDFMSYTRRHFLKICGKIMAVLGLGSIYAPFPEASAAPPPEGEHAPQVYRYYLEARHLRQIITQDPATSRTIMWQLESLPSFLRVEYRALKSPTAHWQDASYKYVQIEDEDYFIFTARLTELQPESIYEYRIVAERSATPWHTIKTPGKGKFQAIIVCDSQCGTSYADWKSTIHSAAARHPEAGFIADIGDIVDNGQSSWHWREWYGGIKDILPSTIFVPVMGNHECYDLKWQMCLPTGYLAQFTQPGNGSLRFPGYYYSYVYGPVHFLVLNTQFEELDGLRPGLLAEQLRWLRDETEKSRSPWKVVLMHKDILAYGWNSYTKSYGGIDIIGHDFMDTFDELGIDLVLSGHMHTYRNRGHIYRGKSSDRGPVYVLCGLSGNAHYDVPDEPDFDKVKAPQPETDNYLTLDADEKELRLRCYLPNGTLIDDMRLTKQTKLSSKNSQPSRTQH